MPWKTVTLDVELDLAEKDEKKPRWQPVRLLFVRGLKELGEAEASKKDWALFLTTDTKLGMSKMLETCAGDIRSQMQDQMDALNFAGRLWQIFRAIISGTLTELRTTLGCSANTVMLAVDKRVHEFFSQSSVGYIYDAIGV